MSRANSWNQRWKTDGRSSNRAADDSALLTPLELLNDDCLLAIYEYLEPYDVANLSTISLRLEEFAAKYIYKKYANFELIDQNHLITFPMFQTMLNRFGDHIESISLSGYAFNRTNVWLCLHCALRMCTNLKTLKIRCFKFRSFQPYHMAKLCIRSNNLIAFEIIHCDGITDDWLRLVLNNLLNLRSIKIVYNTDIVGEFMISCRNLVSISLIDCREIEKKTLQQIFKNNSDTMRDLKLVDCRKLEGCMVIPIIVGQLPYLNAISLRLFHLKPPHILNCLAELQYLRRLQIGCINQSFNICPLLNSVGDKGLLEDLVITRELMQCFNKSYDKSESILETIAAQLPKLRSFSSMNFHWFTDSSVVHMFRCCPRIERLDIVGAKLITFAAVRQIVEILQADYDVAAASAAETVVRRPLLKFNLDTRLNMLTDEQYDWLAQNRHLIRLTEI